MKLKFSILTMLFLSPLAVSAVTPNLSEVSEIGSTTDTTPSYTFSSDQTGTITYGGSCSSSTTAATSGDNTITFDSLSTGTYSDCTVTVTNAGDPSTALSVSTFTIKKKKKGGKKESSSSLTKKKYSKRSSENSLVARKGIFTQNMRFGMTDGNYYKYSGGQAYEVEKLQKYLNDSLRINIREDGVYRAETKAAVRALQKSLNNRGYNLFIDGIFGERTRVAVNHDKYGSDHIKVCRATLLEVHRIGDVDGGISKYDGGITSTEIKKIQAISNALIDTNVRVDGVYGPETNAAVIHLQRELGRRGYTLDIDGIFGPETRLALNDHLCHSVGY